MGWVHGSPPKWCRVRCGSASRPAARDPLRATDLRRRVVIRCRPQFGPDGPPPGPVQVDYELVEALHAEVRRRLKDVPQSVGSGTRRDSAAGRRGGRARGPGSRRPAVAGRRHQHHRHRRLRAIALAGRLCAPSRPGPAAAADRRPGRREHHGSRHPGPSGLRQRHHRRKLIRRGRQRRGADRSPATVGRTRRSDRALAVDREADPAPAAARRCPPHRYLRRHRTAGGGDPPAPDQGRLARRHGRDRRPDADRSSYSCRPRSART